MKKKKLSKRLAASSLAALMAVATGLGLNDYLDKENDNNHNLDDTPDTSNEFVYKNPERPELPDIEFVDPDLTEKLENSENNDLIETPNVQNNVGNKESIESVNPVNNTETNETHKHTLGEWVSLNDDFEASYCPEDNTLVGTRLHNYRVTGFDKISNNDGTHNEVIINTCINCNHEKIVTTRTVDCGYGNLEWDNVYEYENCLDCGYKHIIGRHKLDNGTIDYKNKTITYSCEHPGCGYMLENEYKPSKPSNSRPSSSGNSGNHGGSDYSHTHYLGEWVSLNDDLEANYCPRDGVLVETRAHKYGALTSTTNSNNDGTHTTVNKETCINCNHIKTTTKIDSCNYVFNWDDSNEYNECSVCGDIKIIGSHNLDNGTIDVTNNTITYSCQNSGCGFTRTESYTKPENHDHDFGPWTNNGNNEVRYCINPGCSDPVAKEFKSHIWDNWNENHTERNCKTCDAVEKHGHTFGSDSTDFIPNGTSMHDIVISRTCTDSTCNHTEEVSRNTVGCSFTITISETDTTITKGCVCGNTFIENKNIEHKHNFGAWTNNGSNEIRHCTDPNCPVPGGAAETQDHSWSAWNENHTERTCSCGAVDTHSHSFKTIITDTSSGDRTHTHVVTEKCSDCGKENEISRGEVGCNFTKGSEVTDSTTGITTITYSCTCGNSYTETKGPVAHTHVGGTLQERAGSGDVCYETYKVCTECGKEYDISSHGHNKKDAGFGIQVCRKCNKTFAPTNDLPAQSPVLIPEEVVLPGTDGVLTNENTGLDGTSVDTGQDVNNLPNTNVEQNPGDLSDTGIEQNPDNLPDTGVEQNAGISQGENDTGSNGDAGEDIVVIEKLPENEVNNELDEIIAEQDAAIREAEANAEARLEGILASDASEAEKNAAIDKVIEDTDRAIGEAIAQAETVLSNLTGIVETNPAARVLAQ